MLITDQFILLNLPKTASTFARKVIKKAYRKRIDNWPRKLMIRLGFGLPYRELMLPNIKVPFRSGKDQHGIFDQIPDKYLESDRDIVSIIRNPFEAYISRFTYGSWKKFKPENMEVITDHFPEFPDLTFKRYIEYNNFINRSYRLRENEINTDVTLGTLSVQYIQMFCRNYRKVLAEIDKEFKSKPLYRQHFPDITFLKTETINDDLYRYLLNQGFQSEEVEFIKKEQKVKVSSRKPASEFLDSSAVEMILDYEWLLFELFPEYKAYPDEIMVENAT